MENDKKFKDLIQTVGLLFFLGDIKKKSSEKNNKKKALKMTSHLFFFRAFLFDFRLPDPKSEKNNPINQLMKKLWPKSIFCLLLVALAKF